MNITQAEDFINDIHNDILKVKRSLWDIDKELKSSDIFVYINHESYCDVMRAIGTHGGAVSMSTMDFYRHNGDELTMQGFSVFLVPDHKHPPYLVTKTSKD